MSTFSTAELERGNIANIEKEGEIVLTELPFKRHNAPFQIERNKSFYFTVLSDIPMGSCHGDSGSPVFMKSPDGKSCVIAVLAGGIPGTEIKIDNITSFSLYGAPTPIKYPQLLELIKEEKLPTPAERRGWKLFYGLETHVFTPLEEHEKHKRKKSMVSGSDDADQIWKCSRGF